MRLPNNIMSYSRDQHQRINSLIQSFEIDVQLSRKVWIAIVDDEMQKELSDHDYYNTPNDVFNDLVVDYDHENLKGFKVDIANCCSEEDTYIEYKGFQHEVGYDAKSKIHTCLGIQYFDLRGSDISQIKNVDLSKFYKRFQIEDVQKDNLDKPRLPTKFQFEDSMEIDSKLLINWIKHQLMSTMFKCTYDPFYMEENQIQQENKGYSPNEPVYDIPEGFTVQFFNLYIKDNYVDLLK